MNERLSYPWIGNKKIDTFFILGPAFYSVVLAFTLSLFIPVSAGVSLIPWIIFVFLIDVSHVYSSLYRTYLNPVEFEKNSSLLFFTPIACFVIGLMLYSVSALLFWRCLAYLAVFHFVRQQYGIMRIYSRNDLQISKLANTIDTTTVYLATLYPLAYWHANLPRNFSWFIDNDFLMNLPIEFANFVGAIYAISLITLIAKEIYFYTKKIPTNVPKIIFIFGTSLSWFVGIVLFNNDLIFTITNVVSHGIPYFALIWINGRKDIESNSELKQSYFRYFFSSFSIPIFLGFLFLISFLEEGLWAGFVWREHLDFFRPFAFLPTIKNHSILTWIIPLLALPQMTHYVLDGFIWKKKRQEENSPFS